MMNKHTPGPWMHVAGSDPKTKTVIQTPYSAAGQLEACSPDVTIAQKVLKRDADLIAAAPELLKALKSLPLECSTNRLNPCWDNRPADVPGKHWADGDACPGCTARAAIAKAEGTDQ